VKAIILNGMNQGDPVLPDIETTVSRTLEKSAWEVRRFVLHETKIAPCMGKFSCWEKTPGECILKDAGRDIARATIQSDMAVLLSPITFGGYSSQLKKALDRMICLLLPFFIKIDGEFHHPKRYRRYPSILGVGVLDKPDDESEAIFKKLVKRNAVNFHCPHSAVEIFIRGMAPETINDKINAFIQKLGINP
jgi:multimeric flavodoxin WrbA